MDTAIMSTETQALKRPRAPLPVNYEHARIALRECQELDECAEWANKSEAIASYARQAKDLSLLNTAKRIKARATRRLGQLLREIPPAKAGRPAETIGETIGVGAYPNYSKRKAASSAADLSTAQAKQAMRVAAVPDLEFETLVESEEPPTVTELAEKGKGVRTKKPGDEPTDAQRKHAHALWEAHSNWHNDQVYAAVGFSPKTAIEQKRCKEMVEHAKHYTRKVKAAAPQTPAAHTTDPRVQKRSARDDEVRLLFEQNLGSLEIAKKLGCSRTVVQEAKLRLGLGQKRDTNPLRRLTSYAVEFCDTWSMALDADRVFAGATRDQAEELTSHLRELVTKTNALIRRLNKEAKGDLS